MLMILNCIIIDEVSVVLVLFEVTARMIYRGELAHRRSAQFQVFVPRNDLQL